MGFLFKAKIYKVGINPCVKVPLSVSGRLQPARGYIPIKGTIDGHTFIQTLVPVKGEGYRLYVNGPMLKASGKAVRQTAVFEIEQDLTPAAEMHPMPDFLKKKLKEEKLVTAFEKLTPYRQKEIIRYLGYLKTEEAVKRNLLKVVEMLRVQ